MKRAPVLILTLFVMAACWASADDVKTADVLAVKAYSQGRIAYWEGRVPIFDGYPLYDITLTLAQKRYVVRYESVTSYYPSSWKAGKQVKVRLQGKKRMYLLNGSDEVPVEIVNAHAQDCVPATAPPAGPMAGPQVPCD